MPPLFCLFWNTWSSVKKLAKKLNKSVDKRFFLWYYCKALARAGAKRTLKIKQRQEKEPDKIQELKCTHILKDRNSNCELVFEKSTSS